MTDLQLVEGRISVVMPCFNAERYLVEAVESVLGQTYRDVELIVVDDGSSDRSLDILRSYVPRIVLLQQPNRGPYPARNAGLKAATGEFVAFLDADDYWRADCLATLQAALVRERADLAYCGWQNVGTGSPGTAPYIPPRYYETDTVRAFLEGCPWPIHAALVRRRVIDAVGGFSERLFTSMDYDLWLRILAETRHMVLVPETMAFYRWHNAGQISSIKWRQALDACQARRDFVRVNVRLVAHLGSEAIRRLVDGPLLRTAYQAYWRRDLVSARLLFRKSLARGIWSRRDIKYLLPSLLPRQLYCALIGALDRRTETRTRV